MSQFADKDAQHDKIVKQCMEMMKKLEIFTND